MKKGWVRIHRQIEDNSLYFLEPFTKAQAWMDLVIFANHSDGEIDIRGNIVPIKRGQIGWSEITLSQRWQWSKGKVRRFLRLLETRQQISQVKDRYLTTIITVLNYDSYQGGLDDTADGTADGQQTVQQTDSRQYINKNDNNKKNEKNGKKEIHPAPVPVAGSAPAPAPLVPIPNCPSIKLTKPQAQSVKAKFEAHGLTRVEIMAACELLENYAQNGNAKKFQKYKDHARVLCAWPLQQILKDRKTAMQPKTFNAIAQDEDAEASRKFLAMADLQSLNAGDYEDEEH